MPDWTIPGNYVRTKDFGADLDLSSSHHNYKAGIFTATLELRVTATGEWLGPKVFVKVDASGASITDFEGEVAWSSDSIDFSHAGVQGLLDRSKIVAFVSAKVPDPRP